MNTSVPSNTFVGFVGFCLAFALCLYGYHLQATKPLLAVPVCIAACSLVFFGLAVAQLRSGYFWRNLSPGSRGLHRSDAPVRFRCSVALHLVLGVLIVALAVWRYVSPP